MAPPVKENYNNDHNLKATSKNGGSTYKERKQYETNEQLFNRDNQLRFSSLSMQLLGKTRKPNNGKDRKLIYLLIFFIF